MAKKAQVPAITVSSKAKLAPDVKIPTNLKHPEKLQALAKVRCHTSFGYHRIALINNSIVLFDHDLAQETAWQELGGRPTRCATTLRCFQVQRHSAAPPVMQPFVKIASQKHFERVHKREQESRAKANRKYIKENEQYKRYLRALLRYKCKYRSINRADTVNIKISIDGWFAVGGTAGAVPNTYNSRNAAIPKPYVVELDIITPNREQFTSKRMPRVIDGYFIVGINWRLMGLQCAFDTYVVSILTEEYVELTDSYTYGAEYTAVQFRNGFWYMGNRIHKTSGNVSENDLLTTT